MIWFCWVFVALFFSSQAILRGISNYPFDEWGVFLREFIQYQIWFLLTPLVVWLSEKFPVVGGQWLHGIFGQIIFGLLISFLHVAVYIFILHATNLAIYPSTYLQRLHDLWLFYFHFNLVCYWIIFTLGYTINYYRKYQERDLTASKLETQLVQSQLQALKMQLHPHFLFNTLNTISVLMKKDVKAANRMLVSLSELLRTALDDIGAQEVPLKQELDFLERYLKIEEIRFHGRLQVQINVTPETLDAQVPNLILQPLVENAVRHGIAPQIVGGTIEINAEREGEMLHLFVRDDGAGAGAPIFKEGIGLSNTRARLKKLYDEHHFFQAGNATEGGFLVDIIIPFRTKNETLTF